jgi:DNA modification methylase
VVRRAYGPETLETGVLYCGDNHSRLAAIPTESVDLIYLDPPFFSNRQYEVIWGDEAEVRSFEDRWDGGIQHYIGWMRQRVFEMHRVLKPTGSIYLHCDWHASHYLKIMLDEIFGMRNFQNEFIWHYGGGGASKKRWGRKHDTLLFYSKGRSWTFNVDDVRVPHKWTSGQRRADGSERNQAGKIADDVWSHHGVMPWASERLGYPTQKPEALLERVILASSNPGDVVLDPFCGCGTSVAVAERLRRQWIGIDISPTAVRLMERRLQKSTAGRCSPVVVGLPTTADDLRALKPFEFQNWVIQQFFGTASPRKSGDMGIDGYTFLVQDPVQVKQSDSVGRNVVDNFETAMRRAGRQKGYIVGFSFSRGAKEEVARARWHDQLDITLVTVEELLRPPAEDRTPLFPVPATVLDLPLGPPRPQAAMMSADELMQSHRSVTA